MTLDLPGPIAAYFAADRAGGADIARCFTDDAFVTDEDHIYHVVLAGNRIASLEITP